LVVFYAI